MSLRNLLSACSIALLAACSSLGPPRVDVTMDKLQASIAKQFPFSTEFARLLDITVSAPRLRGMAAENRIATDIDLSLAPRFLNRKFAGSLSFDSALRFEPRDNTVRLVSPRLQKFDLPGFRLSDTEQGDLNLGRLAEFIVESAMNDMVVHQVNPEDLKRLGTQYKPEDIKVTANGVSVTFAAQK